MGLALLLGAFAFCVVLGVPVAFALGISALAAFWWEGLPLIVPEALRNGTPVLVSDNSGLPDLVEAGTSGLVFELEEAALAKCLAALRRQDLRNMRPAARKSYEARFSMERFAKEMAGHLSTLVQRK